MSNRCPQRCGRWGAFTLVELLVVIGIIGVLIAILLPVLNKVKQHARATQCASHLADMGKGWAMYQNANAGVVIPGRMPKELAGKQTTSIYWGGMGNEYRPKWYEVVGIQVKKYANKNPRETDDDTWQVTDDWFLCPAVPDWRNNRNYPIGYNYQFLGNARPRPIDKKWINYPVKSSSLKASTVMAMDSMGTAAGKPRKDRSAYMSDGTHDRSAVGNKGYFVDPPRMTDKSDYADTQHRNPDDRAGPDARHMGLVNVLFCDGHVERISIQSMGYLVRADGSIAIDGPGTTNKLFSGDGTDKDPPPVDLAH
jgi:prepilin-type processing-associated H-X9-DG protein/prepilin-type N-terminal cleavage/methylation domain-containing protein